MYVIVHLISRQYVLDLKLHKALSDGGEMIKQMALTAKMLQGTLFSQNVTDTSSMDARYQGDQ